MNLEERERIIDGLVDKGGIFGAEVCQVCGEVATFSGWASAMGDHDAGEFVPFRHGHVEPDSITAGGGHSYGPKARSRLRELLAADERFCEVCCAKNVQKRARRVRNQWLCPVCAPTLSDDEAEAHDVLHRLSLRRYVETRTDEDLGEWAAVAGVSSVGPSEDLR